MAKKLSADIEVSAAGSADHRSRGPEFSAIPLWVIAVTAASGAVFTYGLLAALQRVGPASTSIAFTTGETVLYLVLATVGRIAAVVIQAAVVSGAAGPAGKLRAMRRAVLVGTFWSQLPLVIRDLGLGVAAIVGLSIGRVVGLALSPFDPFTLVSVYVFYRFARRLDLGGDRKAMVRMIVTFTAYLTLIKLALFLLGAAL